MSYTLLEMYNQQYCPETQQGLSPAPTGQRRVVFNYMYLRTCSAVSTRLVWRPLNWNTYYYLV
jgi:hypothetical protein